MKNIQASTTNRQMYSTNYTGNAEGQNEGGYQVANAVPKFTKKQFLSDNDYTGNAGGKVAPMSYNDIYNATIKSIKGDLIHNRLPGPEGVKRNYNVTRINATTNKLTDERNLQLNQRGVQPSKIYNSIPQNMICGETKAKETIPNIPIANRLDPNLLNPFRKNPYTQSLHSYTFQ